MEQSRGIIPWISCLSLLAGSWCCNRDTLAPKLHDSPTAPASASPLLAPVSAVNLAEPRPYPPGGWRRVPADELNHTILWLAHILIRHDRVNDFQVPFTVTDWISTEPATTRSSQEALALAEQLAREARERGNFAELARELSEDPETRARNGSLGGVVARHLSAWPQVLDAVSTLAVGDISRPVRTPYGYHVFQRREPLPKAVVTGAHVVIAHGLAPWIQVAARRELPPRSREEAFAIAREVYERARAEPSRFSELVQQYSDHQDAQRDGDFGTWSTHDPSSYPRELETLAYLEVGQVAEPIDTIFGVQVIMRTPNRERQRYAVAQVQLRFDPNEPDAHPASQPSVRAKADELVSRLRRDPDRFQAIQDEWCCADILEVIEGRDNPRLEATLARLSPGEIAQHPVRDTLQYLIPKRLDASVLSPAPQARFDLPAPTSPAPN